MGQNLTGQTIASTYEDLVQIFSGSILTDGTGSNINYLTVTASNAFLATTASYALNAGGVNTGSLMVTGSATGNVLTFTKGDGSTFNLTVATGSGGGTVNTGSLLVTASISDATITFTKGDASTFGITVNNVVNANSASVATSASFATNALTASYAQNVTPINTGSFYVSSSVNNATITFTQGDGTTEAVTVNNVVNATSASFATTAATSTSASYATFAANAGAATTATSASHAVNADNAISASFASTAATATSANTATSASFATTAATASFLPNTTNLNVASISASNANFTTLTATSASIGYLQTVTGSATIIGDAFILLNTSNATRYAGILVEDSGSGTPTNYTASFQFDSQTNDWFYEYSGSDPTNFGVAMFGPEYATKGTPTYLTNNRVPKGNGGHHLNDSNITDNGTTVSINSNTEITGSLKVTGGITASLQGTASFAVTASYVELGTSATGSFTAAATWSFAHNLNQQPVVVQTFDSNWEEIIPEKIDLIDANNATITFPVAVAGYAVASLGNGITQGSAFTNPISSISYNQGAATSPSLYRSKLTISTPGIYNLHVSESGPYWVDLRPLGSANSGSINIYMWADQLSTFSANLGSTVVFSGQSGSGTYVSYRTIITGSSSTEYWVANTTVGTSTSNLSRTATQERRDFGGVAGNPNTVVKYPDGTLMFTAATGNTAIPGNLYRFTGSNGTPIV